MITVKFEKHDQSYKRTIALPDGGQLIEHGVVIPPQWHSPETWSWVKPLHEYTRDQLAREGRAVAQALLGQKGQDYIKTNSPGSTRLVVFETRDLPEIARVPWEIACIDNEFIIIDRFIPLVRQPEHVQTQKKLSIHRPLRMVLISAAPTDQPALMIEEEMLSTALALGEQMAEGNIVVHEVLNCSREKLVEILRGNQYDIFYFTGHGHFQENTGFLALENPDRTADLVPAGDVITALRRQEGLSLVFLNCCNAAAVGRPGTPGWQGFNDVARKVLKMGVPEVIATQAAIFDTTARKVMKSFFQELCPDERFNVARALTTARCDVDSEMNEFHDFYHFVHLSALAPEPGIEVLPPEAAEDPVTGWREKVAYRTGNYMPVDKNFVGRFSYISRIEDAWWRDAVKAAGIHGLGGIGKTFLCSRMEERALCHAVAAKRLNQTIWLDFREGQGNTLAGFLVQLAGLAHDLGFPEYQKVLDDHETFPTPLEKLRPFSRHLESRFKGKVLLILDNLETALDKNGEFQDPELGTWFSELVAHTPPGVKLLVTSRYRFEFFPGGRQLARTACLHLSEMGFTERVCLVNQWTELRNLPEEQKYEIIRTAGGHPFLVNLVVKYLQKNPALPEAIIKASKETAVYARLDGFLSLLTPGALDWLFTAAVFPEPRRTSYIIAVKLIRESLEDIEQVKTGFNRSIEELVDLGLVTMEDPDTVHIHSLVIFQLLQNRESRFHQSLEKIKETRQAIGRFFLVLNEQIEERPAKAQILVHGIEPVLCQDDVQLINEYLEKCAAVFHGFVPGSVFAGIVRRVEDVLFKKADEFSFNTLGFCAQTLTDMRHFQRALEIYNRLVSHDKLPDNYRGKMLFSIGNIYFYQRQWDKAVESYKKAIDWSEKTGNQSDLGTAYHQVGMVYAEQRQWEKALENYQQGLEWNEKTGNHYQLGSTFHQVGMVYAGQRQWEKALENYRQALEWNEKTGNHYALGATFHQVGMVYAGQRQWEKALENYQQALEWDEKTGNHYELGGTFHQVGNVYYYQRQWEKALENYQRALEWKEKTGNHYELGKTFHQVGNVYYYQRQWEKALENYRQALEWNEKTGNHYELGSTFHQVGMVYEEQKEFSTAFTSYKQGLQISLQTGNQEAAEYNILSLRRIFPHLSREEIETLKKDLPEELFQAIMGKKKRKHRPRSNS